MSSSTLKACFLSQCFSASASSEKNYSLALVSWRSNWLNSSPFVNFQRRSSAFNGKLLLKAQFFDSFGNSKGSNDKNNDDNAADYVLSDGNSNKCRREILLEYVRNVEPEFMKLFVERAPVQVVDAMRQTVTSMIGTLPPQFFDITVSAVAENLAHLMYNVIMTGYMFRNVQYRLELQQSLDEVVHPETDKSKDAPEFAPGTQKKVTGEVIRWNYVSGPEKLDAGRYIELLEAEIKELKGQIERISVDRQNELLNYLAGLEPQNLQELTSTAGEDVILAMNTFIERLLAISDPRQMKTTVSESTGPELSNSLFWLMVVGYSIRNIEVRFDMEHALNQAELPPDSLTLSGSLEAIP